jgi:hypothetical protein
VTLKHAAAMFERLTAEMQAEYQASITPENLKRMLEQRGIALDGKPIEGARAA